MLESIHAESSVRKQSALFLPSSEKNPLMDNLVMGQLLEGKVLKLISDHRFLINFRGFEVIAESLVALKPGLQIQTRVVQTHPQVVMTLMTEGIPDQTARALLRSYLPLRVDWGELIESLGHALRGDKLGLLEMVIDARLLGKVRSALSSLSVGGDPVGDGEKIKQFIEHAGLFYESKLQALFASGKRIPKQRMTMVEKDFKGLLLELSQQLAKAAERTDAIEHVGLKEHVNHLLQMVGSSIKRIELQQLVNYLTQTNDQQLVLQIPWLLPEGMKTAELYIRYGNQRGRKKKGNKDDYQIVFLLHMGGLGKLRIDTQLFHKKVRCTIQTDSREAATFVNEHVAELRNRLESLTYEVEKISCVTGKEQTRPNPPIQGFSLFEIKLVDIVA